MFFSVNIVEIGDEGDTSFVDLLAILGIENRNHI
jgi:hypothetical protein